MSKFKKNIVYNFLGQSILTVLGLVAFKYTYSKLGEDALGIIYFSLMISVLLTSALDMGLNKTTIREIASKKNNHHYIEKLIQTFSCVYWFAYVVVLCAFLLSLEYIVNSWINLESMSQDEAFQGLLLIGCSSLLTIPKTFLSSIFIGLQKMAINNGIEVILSTLQQLGVVIFLLSGEGFLFIAWWLALTNVLKVVVYLIFVVRSISLNAINLKFSLGIINGVKVYAGKMALISLVLVVHKQLDKILISKFLPIGVLGMYNFIFTSLSKTSFLTASVTQAAFPAIAEEYEEGQENKKLIEKFFLIQDALIIFMLPLFVLIIYISKPLFSFLLDEDKASYLFIPICLLSLSFYLNCALRMLSTYVSAIGKPGYILKLNLWALLFSTPVAVFFVMKYGIVGAAVSWVFYYVFSSFYIVSKIYFNELNVSPYHWFKLLFVSLSLGAAIYYPAWSYFIAEVESNVFIIITLFSALTLLYLFVMLNTVGKVYKGLLYKNFLMLMKKVN
jgi:O-antigen/teichoic acid export membrane protein